MVSYKHLIPGKEYTVTGKLMDKSTGKVLIQDGKEITTSITFTPAEPDGTVTVEFTAGQSVFDVLLATVKAQAIHMEYQNTPMYETAYIEGIGNLYEFDCGSESGWMYKVNGWFPNYGCSSYTLSDGDVIVWCYTCNGLGADVGGGMG